MAILITISWHIGYHIIIDYHIMAILITISWHMDYHIMAIFCKKTNMYVFKLSLSRSGPKIVGKVPYGSGVSENGVGIKKNAFPDQQIAKIMPGPKIVRFTISHPDKDTTLEMCVFRRAPII